MISAPRVDVAIVGGDAKPSFEYARFFNDLATALNRRQLPNGISVTVPLAKLTGGGSDGSLTFVDGILTAVTAPT